MAIEIPGQILPVVDEKKLADPIWYEWFTYLRGIAKSVVSLLAFQANAEAAWTTFIPNFTAAAGGPPTVTVVTARYRQIGKTVDVFYHFNIPNINGSSGACIITLPKTPTARGALLMGVEVVAVGTLTRAALVTAAGAAVMVYIDGTTPFINGRGYYLGGTYEV